MAKRVVKARTNLLTVIKKKKLKKYSSKSKTNKECFDYRKNSYYTRNYHTSNKKKPKDLLEKVKSAWWEKY